MQVVAAMRCGQSKGATWTMVRYHPNRCHRTCTCQLRRPHRCTTTLPRIHHAVFDVPNEVMVDGAGAVFVTEGNKYTGKNNRIRMINSHTGAVQTLVGCDDAMPGYVDGSTTVASANHPIGIAVDDDGCLVFADSDNHCIR
eukprot:m.1262125 g.1262125  ORF g.1262125 m.1262125 type:complete len:141 (-) comp24733_c0_seq38:3371-3793(-)